MKWYLIRAAAGKPKTADVLIFGEIGESWWGEETVTAKSLAQELADLDADTLNVRINSYGGSVADGLAIYNALRRHPAAKAVTVEGVAVSIASLIAMAGDTVDMPANTLLMIHAPWGLVQGNAADMRETADTLDRMAQAMATSYARKSGQTEAAILALLQDGKDHWYTAAEAQAAGFADTVSAELAVQASIPPRFRAQAPLIPLLTGGRTMAQIKESPDTTAPGATAAAPPPTPEPATAGDNVVDIRAAATRDALAAEQNRRRDIKNLLHGPLARRKDLVEVMNACLDDMTVTADEASARLLRKAGEGLESIGGAGAIAHGADARDKFVMAGAKAILARCGVEKNDGANPYRGFRLHEMARACLEAAGGNVGGMLPEEFVPYALGNARRAYALHIGQTTSDFPAMLEGVINRIVLNGFQLQPTTWQKFCKSGDVTDFREWKRIVPGLITNLDPVNEQGEYLNKNLPDGAGNSVSAKRHGNIVAVTPEVIVNDDIGFIAAAADGYGRTGARTIEKYVYALLAANPVLADGYALFSAQHGNLAATGAAPTVETLDAARTALATQRAPSEDEEYLDIVPTIALVHTGKLGALLVTVNSEFDPEAANKLQRPNMVRGIVQDVVGSPRLPVGAWYLFADPNVAPVIEVVFLNGQREPRVVEQEDFRTGGIAWRIELPFGVGAVDYRGGYKNPGA